MAGTVGKSNWLARTPTSRPLLDGVYTSWGICYFALWWVCLPCGDRSPSQRIGALNGSVEERFKVLVATDLASRGIHVRD